MKTIKTTLFTLALTLTLPVAGLAAEHDSRLLLLLNLIDQVPTQAQLLEAGAGPNADALFRVAQDASLKRYPRARAAGLIALFATPKAQLHLAALLDDQTVTDSEVKVQALSGLVYLQGPAAFERLSQLSRDPDPELRAAAVRNLGRIDHPGVQAVLQARLVSGAEPVGWVRDLAVRIAERR